LLDLALHVLALLVYPGGLLTLAVGAVAEVAAGLVLDGAAVRDALVAPFVRLRRAAVSATPLLVGVTLLAFLAATQVAIPFNPVTPLERNLLTAAVAIAAAAWLGWARAWATGGARLTLLAQWCWLVALMAPAMLAESLRPAALGTVAVPAELPLKLAAGLLALLCLPALLQVMPGATPGDGTERADEAVAVRTFLWLPLCGLFASLFFPPGADDLGGVLRFLAITLGTAAVGIGLAAVVARWGAGARRLSPRAMAPVALAIPAIAAITSLLS
jgi:hypothetical protein